MLVSTKMITGFNTDVPHEGHVYHVQTEDGGTQNPILESLVYVGGTIVAKKRTPYSDQLSGGASEEAVALLLKRQHQVIIAAIKAGRIEDLIRHSQKEESGNDSHNRRPTGKLTRPHAERSASSSGSLTSSKPFSVRGNSGPIILPSIVEMKSERPSARNSGPLKLNAPPTPGRTDTGGLNLDQVIADYLKRNSDQASLDVRVLTPEVFVAGSNIALRVQVAQKDTPEIDAIVTVKIIGTAFKPQVFIGRVGRDGVASFSLALPSFTAGTAAMVIEARSGAGRGELKKLIRRA